MTIEELRNGIDALDRQIVPLINERCKLARRIGKIKAERGLPVFDPAREQSLLNKLAELNPGPLPEDSLRAIYREIMAAAKKLEQTEKA